jgi:glycosyltransferase involved in cell wall biosynthesis
METSSFLVSAIIPVYNGEAFLAEAVETIRQQNYHPLEIIIVDDGSTDNTERIARGFNKEVIYVRQENSGPPAARNRGIKMAKGDLIGFLDVDDLWSENKLGLQVTLLKDASSVEIVVGYTQILMLKGAVDGESSFRKWSDPVLTMNVGSALFKISVFDKVGLFDETQRYCDDWDWFMRARELNVPILIHKEVTHYYRRHERNMTNQGKLGNHYFIGMLKKSLDRRRQNNDSQAESLPSLSFFGEDPAERLLGSAEEEAID